MDSGLTAMAHLHLEDVPFCALDVETTKVPNETGGLALIEVAAQRFQGYTSTASAFLSLVNPGCSIHPIDIGVSGITDRIVADAPAFTQIFSHFFEYLGDTVIVAHNAAFDRRAIENQCRRDNLVPPENLYVDSVAVLRKVAKLSSYALDSACRHFDLPRSQAHRAEGDCEAVRCLFLQMLPLLAERHGVRRLGQLCALVGLDIHPKPTQRDLFDL